MWKVKPSADNPPAVRHLKNSIAQRLGIEAEHGGPCKVPATNRQRFHRNVAWAWAWKWREPRYIPGPNHLAELVCG